MIGSFERKIRKPVGGISVFPPQLTKKLEERRTSMHEATVKSPVEDKATTLTSPTEPKTAIGTNLRSKSPFSESLVDRWDSKLEEVNLVDYF